MVLLYGMVFIVWVTFLENGSRVSNMNVKHRFDDDYKNKFNSMNVFFHQAII